MTDRSSIDVALARRLVDRQFPQWAGLPVTAVAPDGWDNRTFRLGAEITVRLPIGDWYVPQVDKEQRWLPLARPAATAADPAPMARGAPGAGYPYPWSVYRWLDGEPASEAQIGDPTAFAGASPASSPRWAAPTDRRAAPGEHNFFRGGPLATYEGETLEALDGLGDEVPADASCARGTTR